MYMQVNYSWMGSKVYKQSINLHLKKKSNFKEEISPVEKLCKIYRQRNRRTWSDMHNWQNMTREANFNLRLRRVKTIHLILMGHPRTWLQCYSTWRVATTPANIHFIFRIWNTLLLWKQKINLLQAQRKT